MKKQKGITLIALIITIVVLLILAVVAINSVKDGGILSHAKSAQQTYKDAADNETTSLQNYTDYLAYYSQKENNSGTTNNQPLVLEAGAKVPEGGIYITNIDFSEYSGSISGGTSITDGTIPAIKPYDIFVYGDYIYTYKAYIPYEGPQNSVTIGDVYISDFWPSDYGDWSVAVRDREKTQYGMYYSSINGVAVDSLNCTYYNCKNLTIAPTILNSVTYMDCTFFGCASLITAPTIPNSVTNMDSTFGGCTSLTTAPTIPSSVTDMNSTFAGCTALTTAPTIPNSVTNMDSTFGGCTALTTAPTIPNSVTNMSCTFCECENLTGSIEINTTPTEYEYCFKDTEKNIRIIGSCTNKQQLAETSVHLDLEASNQAGRPIYVLTNNITY